MNSNFMQAKYTSTHNLSTLQYQTQIHIDRCQKHQAEKQEIYLLTLPDGAAHAFRRAHLMAERENLVSPSGPTDSAQLSMVLL